MSTTASTAEYIGASILGCCAWLSVALAAHLGASSAHVDADAELAAHRAERERRMRPAAPAPEPWPALLDIPHIPTSPPAEAIPLQERTLQLHEVKAHRARHRKEPACS
ncbi:hypothetical protein [Streptomyces sp. NBC_00645]|uniref:hypothetical protein n=1 Tax=Streptomyces sp. NBC_00645 TaxID=2975795 RepID=UPI003252939E